MSTSIKTLILLSEDPGTYSALRLKNEALKMGRQFIHQLPWDLSPDLKLESAHEIGLIPRLGTLKFEQSLQALKFFEKNGVRVINSSSAYALARDKISTQNFLSQNNIPTVETLLYSEEFLSPWSYPLVIKPNSSSKGRHVGLAKSLDDLKNKAQEIFHNKQTPIIQPFIAESSGCDLRVFRTKTQAWGYQRENKNDFRSNLHSGGKPKRFDLDQNILSLTEKIMHVMNLDVAGIDLLITKKGPLVLEVNPSPGFEGLEQVHPINAPQVLIGLLMT